MSERRSVIDSQNTDGRSIEIGPDNLEWVALDEIHLLRQVRQEYDQQDIETLAHSIIKDHVALEAAETPKAISAALQLMHPLTLNRLQPDTANRYLHDHALFYDLQQPEIVAEMHDLTLVNIAGHRRYLALEFIIVKLKNLALNDVRILAQVHDNLPFPEALALQLRENIKTNPPPQDEARAIERFYHYSIATTGQALSYVAIANQLGCRPGKVRDALAFAELPSSIQAYAGIAKNGAAIPYSTLVQFKPLLDALRARYQYRYGADTDYSDIARDQDVANDLHSMANKIAQLRLQRMPAVKIDEVLRNKIRLVQGEALVTAETLFDVVGDDPEVRRQRSSQHLAKQALLVLQLLAGQGQLSEQHRQQIDMLTHDAQQTPLFGE